MDQIYDHYLSYKYNMDNYIENAGGLHKFIGWEKPLFKLGVQPFLLAELFKILLLTFLIPSLLKIKRLIKIT